MTSCCTDEKPDLGMMGAIRDTQPSPRDPGARAPHRRRPLTRLLRLVIQLLSIGLVVYVTVKAIPEIRQAWTDLEHANVALLSLALVLEVGALLSLPQVYRVSLRAVGRELPYRETLQISMAAFTLGRVLPGGGLAGAVYATRRMTFLGIEGAPAAAAVGIQGVGQMASLGLLVAVVSFRSALRGDVQGPVLALVAVMAALIAVVPATLSRIVGVTRIRHRLERLAARLVRDDRAQRIREWLDELAELSLGTGQLVLIGGWAALNWMFDFLALSLVLLAVGGDAKAGVLMLGFGVANLLTGLPHIPGGVGLVETGMAGTFIALGLPTSQAISAVLIYRVLSYWLPVIAGVVAYLRMRATMKQNVTIET